MSRQSLVDATHEVEVVRVANHLCLIRVGGWGLNRPVFCITEVFLRETHAARIYDATSSVSVSW